MDIESFAESKIYPFAEPAIALGFLSSVAPFATGITSLFMGISGGISFIKAVYIDKLALNCACFGGNSASSGIVSFTENAIIAVMDAALIFSTVTENAESFKAIEVEPNALVRLQEAGN